MIWNPAMLKIACVWIRILRWVDDETETILEEKGVPIQFLILELSCKCLISSLWKDQFTYRLCRRQLSSIASWWIHDRAYKKCSSYKSLPFHLPTSVDCINWNLVNKCAAVTNIDTTGIRSLEDLLTNLINRKIQVSINWYSYCCMVETLGLNTALWKDTTALAS